MWTLGATNSLASGQSLTDDGRLTITGSLSDVAGATVTIGADATLNAIGSVAGSGSVAIGTGGTAIFDKTFTEDVTFTDGTRTAHITLAGDYSGSTFTASSDGHGGVLITDPAALLKQSVATGLQATSPAAWAAEIMHQVSEQLRHGLAASAA
jgi:hypothetical protein